MVGVGGNLIAEETTHNGCQDDHRTTNKVFTPRTTSLLDISALHNGTVCVVCSVHLVTYLTIQHTKLIHIFVLFISFNLLFKLIRIFSTFFSECCSVSQDGERLAEPVV